MRFVIDSQLPTALSRLLTAHGYTAEHVADIGLRDADDSPILAYALPLRMVVRSHPNSRLGPSDATAPHALDYRCHEQSAIIATELIERILPNLSLS